MGTHNRKDLSKYDNKKVNDNPRNIHSDDQYIQSKQEIICDSDNNIINENYPHNDHTKSIHHQAKE